MSCNPPFLWCLPAANGKKSFGEAIEVQSCRKEPTVENISQTYTQYIYVSVFDSTYNITIDIYKFPSLWM